VGCTESTDTHNIPSWREHAVSFKPTGKASKGMMDIWVGKHSMKREDERTIVLYFITSFLITRSVPDPFRGRFGLFHGAIKCRTGDPKGCTDLWNGSDQHTSAAYRIAHAMAKFLP